MNRLVTLFGLVLGLPALAGPPAMVTSTSGDVEVHDGEAANDAPAPPFLLEDQHTLHVADGAEATVLFQGAATSVHGPQQVNTASLEPADASTGADQSTIIDELLARKSSTARAGAHRAGDRIKLTRPVTGTPLVQPTEIRWACEGCGEVEVKVYDFVSDETLWTANGTDSVTYGGPTLKPGSYSVVVDGEDFVIIVPNAQVTSEAKAAYEAAITAAKTLADPAAKVSVPAAVYLQAGMPSEALYLIDAALAEHPESEALKKLRTDFESRAGLD